MKRIEEDILGSMEELSYKLARIVENTGYEMADAYEEFERLSSEEEFWYANDHTITDEVNGSILSAVSSLKNAKNGLKDADKVLVKILALRLKLAEETGIPLNLSGGREWSRLVEFSV